MSFCYQVISMLYDVRIDSTVNVARVIDNVLEILQTTELFVPQVQTVREEDPLTNDYVGGLCDVSTSRCKLQAVNYVVLASVVGFMYCLSV